MHSSRTEKLRAEEIKARKSKVMAAKDIKN